MNYEPLIFIFYVYYGPPVAPAGPAIPGLPCIPVVPWMPASPVLPCGPVGPTFPSLPCGPAGPVGPWTFTIITRSLDRDRECLGDLVDFEEMDELSLELSEELEFECDSSGSSTHQRLSSSWFPRDPRPRPP